MKLLTIADNTFREGVRQPVYLVVVVFVVALLVVSFFMPFFTLSDDLRMFKDVCLAYILIGLLVTALLLASKVVDEEIENRTMLTLMSKPVRRWELIVGKFVGVMAAVTLALVIFAAVLTLETYLRAPSELRIGANTIDEDQAAKLAGVQWTDFMSLLPAYVLIWLQIAVMAAVAVAISTRAGIVVNLVCGIGLFVVAHLTPFLADATQTRAGWHRSVASALLLVLPHLENLNLNSVLIYLFGDSSQPNQVPLAAIWNYVGLSGLYAGAYVAAVLLVAMALFRTRELG